MSRLMMTKHATDRAAERLGLAYDEFMDMTAQVYERNQRIIGNLGRDLEYKIKSNGMTFVVANGYVLTVYEN